MFGVPPLIWAPVSGWAVATTSNDVAANSNLPTLSARFAVTRDKAGGSATVLDTSLGHHRGRTYVISRYEPWVTSWGINYLSDRVCVGLLEWIVGSQPS